MATLKSVTECKYDFQHVIRNRHRSHLTTICISLTYIKNNKGLRIDPCGKPHGMLETLEKDFSKFTINL